MHGRLAFGAAAAGAAFCLVSAGLEPPLHAQDTPAGVTFARDVAPIIFRSCTSCHRSGEAAPFPLVSYEDVRKRARLVASVTEAGRMPPWKAAPGDYEFRNDRRLSRDDVGTLQRWVDAGMPEGDPRVLPALPAFVDGWQLGAPDLVVSMKAPFSVPAYGRDVYRNFVVPLNLTQDRWVRAIDFRPSARDVVHHSLFFLDDTGAARLRDELDPQPGFRGAMGLVGSNLAGGGRDALMRLFAFLGRGGATQEDVAAIERVGGNLGGWALGGQPHPLPEGLAYFVPKRSDLILSTHFHPSGRVEQETSTVGLYFADQPPTRAFTAIALPPLFGALTGMVIPAGEKAFTLADSFVLPVDVKAFAVGGHAHYLGKAMTLTATTPEGELKRLFAIDDWDFSWQEQYQFKEFVPLAKGTRLDMSISYDNSAGNPRNPNNPPQRVRWGEQSTDEMGGIGLLVVAASDDDLLQLRLGYAAHLRAAALESPVLRRLLEPRNR